MNDFIVTMEIAVGFLDEWNILSDRKADEDVLVEIIKAGANSMQKNGEQGSSRDSLG